MKRNRYRVNGNSGCDSGQVAQRTIETISRTVFLVLRAFGRHLMPYRHLLTTALFLRAFFEMANSGRCIEEIHEKAKQ
jgi:hypothetical protein